MKYAQLDDLIGAVLRGEDATWRSSRRDALAQRAAYHGVLALLNEQLQQNRFGWPPSLVEAIRRESLAQAMWELRHQQVLTQLFQTFALRGIEPVLFKGTALAYDLYSNPVWRVRADTDMIIPARELARCREVLISQGFKRDPAIPGELVSYEESWTLVGPEGSNHSIDLHSKISNSRLLSRLFTYDELRSVARPLPALCPDALGAAPVHALLIACMHRAVHKQAPYYSAGVAHYGGDRLIWLYDIHLLAKRFNDKEWDFFASTAQEKNLGAVCLEALDLAAARFNTRLLESTRAALREGTKDNSVATYLGGSLSRQQWLDFRAIEGYRDKLRYLKEAILPPAAYMRWKYPNARRSWLIWLYVRRILDGISKRRAMVRPE